MDVAVGIGADVGIFCATMAVAAGAGTCPDSVSEPLEHETVNSNVTASETI